MLAIRIKLEEPYYMKGTNPDGPVYFHSNLDEQRPVRVLIVLRSDIDMSQ